MSRGHSWLLDANCADWPAVPRGSPLLRKLNDILVDLGFVCGRVLVPGDDLRHHTHEVSMLKVDTITCVVCGVKEFTKSTGKSARSMNGVCAAHAHLVKAIGDEADPREADFVKENGDGVSKAHVSRAK